MKKSVNAALLSALVYPGVGLFYLKINITVYILFSIWFVAIINAYWLGLEKNQ